MSVAKLGKPKSEQHRKNISLGHMGEKHYAYGKHQSEETIEKKRLSMKGLFANNKHPQWKGDNVGYDALHAWVNRHINRSEICQICKQNKRLDLANITGVYNRDFSNWRYLCRKCHVRYDKKLFIINLFNKE